MCGPNVFGRNGALLTPKLVGTPLLGFPYFYCCITIVGHVVCFPFITGFGAMSTKTSTCSSFRLKRSPRNEMVHLYRSSTPLGKGVVRRPGLLLSLSKVTRVGLGNLIIRALADPYRSVQYYVVALRREVRGGGGGRIRERRQQQQKLQPQQQLHRRRRNGKAAARRFLPRM